MVVGAAVAIVIAAWSTRKKSYQRSTDILKQGLFNKIFHSFRQIVSMKMRKDCTKFIQQRRKRRVKGESHGVVYHIIIIP